jgi:hypothetical protein
LYRQNHFPLQKHDYSSQDLKPQSYDMEIVKSKWAEINTGLDSPSGVKNGLIEADKILDYVLQAKGFNGETMIDRMRLAQDRFSNKEAVWQAHKLRNQIAHEIDKDLVVSQVKKSINDLGQAIKDLGVLL